MRAPPVPAWALVALAVVAAAAPGVLAAAGGPVADFTFEPYYPMLYEPVQFLDLSEPGDAPLASWWWDLGDGTVTTEREPVHVYTTSGWHEVVLTVTDEAGAQDAASLWLRVCDPLVDFGQSVDLHRIHLDGHGCVRVPSPDLP